MGPVALPPIRENEGHGATSDGSRVRSYAPATGALLGEIPVSSKEDVAGTVARARKAQAAWAVLPIEERVDRLLRFRDAIVDRADEIVEIVVKECGKPRHEALVHEVMTVADLATYYCRNAPRILAPQEISLHLLVHRKSVIRYVPRGVVGVISPWNFPFSIPMGDVIAALVTGSAAVVKPSELTPLTLMKAKEIYDSTGLPEDLFGVVYGYGATGAALIDAGIQKLIFTGSVETGKRVAAACGARLIPCVMELGGKAPLIACADADLERTARAIVYGGFANAGQACISVERVYAHRDIYDPLIRRVTELTGELRVGDPSKDYIDVGAVLLPRQIDVAEKQIDDALSKGAELLVGGHRLPGPGQFFEPTVLGHCNDSMLVMREETFGPIVPIQIVDTEEEAIALANRSRLGLNAYVFTNDRRRGRELAERIEAGSVVVNDVLVNHALPEAPFGGVKDSGFGRVHGDDALRDMCEKQHINYDRVKAPLRDPTRYPYSAKTFHWLQRGLRLLFSGSGIVQRIGELF
jgi:succinate-semialdehyde dehydrogenase/glutarate-semialdehyde dehydrogenase